MKTIKFLLLSGVFMLFGIDCLADLLEPLNDKNMFILYISHLYMPPVSAQRNENDGIKIDGGMYLANTNFDKNLFLKNGKQGEFDLETYACTVNVSKKIHDRAEIMFFMPVYYHGGGIMDSPIQAYHRMFPFTVDGLPNGGRETSPNREIHITYEKNKGGPDIDHAFYGIGDPAFYFKYTVCSGALGIAVLTGCKPALGDTPFINSNTIDLGLNVTIEYRLNRFNFFGMLGGTYFSGDGYYKDVFNQKYDFIFPVAAGAAVKCNNSTALIIQFYCHQSIFKTGIKRIDNPTICNSYGVRWKYYDNLTFQFSFIQDSFTLSTADITFNLRAVTVL